MRLHKAYKVILSTKQEIQIDQYEVDKVLDGVSKGSVIIVKRGVVNPSYFVGIDEDIDRRREWMENCKYNDEKSARRYEAGMEPLKSIFENTGTRVEKLLADSEKKLLGLAEKEAKQLES